VGFLKKMKAKSQYQSAVSRYNSELAAWSSESEHVEELLYMATNLDEIYSAAAEAGFSVRLRGGEHVILGLVGAGLIEPRSGGGSYQGGSQGMSFRVAKGVRFRVGQHKGTYVPNPEVLKVIDSGGNAYVTTQRVIYTSPSRSREWDYSKTVDIYHSDAVTGTSEWGATFIGVSNRQKTSGFVYPMTEARRVRDRLLLAMAIHDGTVEDMVVGLKEQSSEMARNRPVEPSRPPELEV
jgi:hypothetical protein